MAKKILIMVSVVMLMALVGCHQETVEVTNTTKPSTTVTTTTKVEFKDGSYGEQTIKTSFDKDGYVLMEYIK